METVEEQSKKMRKEVQKIGTVLENIHFRLGAGDLNVDEVADMIKAGELLNNAFKEIKYFMNKNNIEKLG